MQPDTLSRDLELESIQPADALSDPAAEADRGELESLPPIEVPEVRAEPEGGSGEPGVQAATEPVAARKAASLEPVAGVRDIPCDQCGGEQFLTMFEKESSRGERYQLVRCVTCDLVQVNPQPDARTVAPYYEREYFTKRTDRGYNNYFSEELKAQINKVYEQNLSDLSFFEYEQHLQSGSWLLQHLGGAAAGPQRVSTSDSNTDHRPRSLDVGCAAGYFVQYLAERGWNAQGVELSRAAANFGIKELKLDILVADFLTCRKLARDSYDLISLWASIEHMHSPRKVLARAFELLKPGGRMILSTCRYGVLAKLRGIEWRFMNVPEHLYFFSLEGLTALAADIGFRSEASVTYGSGLTGRADASLWYRAAKRIADPAVKRWNQGDMMALHLSKPV